MRKLQLPRPNPTWRTNQASSATALSAAQADADQSRADSLKAQQSAEQAEADKLAMRAKLVRAAEHYSSDSR